MNKRIVSWALICTLALTACVGAAFAADSGVLQASPSTASVTVNGKACAIRGYLIGGAHYFKLRDIAAALNGTEKQFEVEWDGAFDAIRMTSQSAYTVLGGELTGAPTQAAQAVKTTSTIYVDGVVKNFDAYYIAGNNYFKLRDVMETFDVAVDWDAQEANVAIDTSRGYGQEDAAVTEEQMAAAAEQIVKVYRYNEDGWQTSVGLGFFVTQDGTVITSYQAVRGAYSVKIVTQDGTEYPVKGILSFDENNNIAALQTDAQSDAPLKLADSVGTSGAIEVAVFSFDGGGRAASAETAADGAARLVLSSGKASPNSIGGPVINNRMEVVGLYYCDDLDGAQQSFAVPSKEIQALTLRGEARDFEALNKSLYPLANTYSLDDVGHLLHGKIKNFPFMNKHLQIDSVIVTQEEETVDKIIVDVNIISDEWSGQAVAMNIESLEGSEQIVKMVRTMVEALPDYLPGYEIEGRVNCYYRTSAEPPDDAIRVEQIHEQDYTWGVFDTVLFFEDSCERNGFYSEIKLPALY